MPPRCLLSYPLLSSVANGNNFHSRVGSGVRITTLRTQLRSIPRKVGADQQADLIRVLCGVPKVPVGNPKTV
jgi:hypothetical protein